MLFQKSFVILHHQLRLELFLEFHRHRYDDQNTGRREYVNEIEGRPRERNGRDKRDQRQIDGAEQRDTVGDLFQIRLRRFTGTNTLNKAAVLLNTLGHVLRIELHLRVEERECEDEYAEHQRVHDRAPAFRRRRHPVRPPSVERVVAVVDKAADHLRETQNREREDERHNAAAADTDGNGRRLTAVHFSALDLFRILYGYLSFRKIYVDDRKENDRADKRKRNKLPDRRRIAAEDFFELTDEGVARRRKDTGEDDHRLTVAYAVIGDPFAKPHNDERARRIHDGHKHARQPFLSEEQFGLDRAVVAAETYDDTDRLNNCQKNGDVTRILRDLFTSFFTLFGESFQRGNTDAQKLHDDRRVDVGSDTERKDRTLGKRAARDAAHQREEIVSAHSLREFAPQQPRNGNETTDTEHQQQKEHHIDLMSDLLYFESIDKCF